MGVALRVCFVGRMHLPSQFGSEARTALYAINGAAGPIDGRIWRMVVWKYRLGQNAPAHCDPRVI